MCATNPSPIITLDLTIVIGLDLMFDEQYKLCIFSILLLLPISYVQIPQLFSRTRMFISYRHNVTHTYRTFIIIIIYALFIIPVYLGFKFYPSLLETVGLLVPTRYLKDFSTFNFGPSIKNCPSAGCALVTYVVCREFDTFQTKIVSLIFYNNCDTSLLDINSIQYKFIIYKVLEENRPMQKTWSSRCHTHTFTDCQQKSVPLGLYINQVVFSETNANCAALRVVRRHLIVRRTKETARI
jgi:hypothetical protein